jgi:hypothetical protein
VSPVQLGAALVLLAGALIAVSARDPRWILGGLVVSVGLAALVADPLPTVLAIAIRLVAALLGAELVLLAVRGVPVPSYGAPLGPVTAALAGAAAVVVGYAASGVGSPAAGPPLASGVGLGLATIAIGPLLLGRDIVRIGSAMALLVTAAELVRAGLAGTPGPLEQGVIALVTIGILAATAAIVASALHAGHDLAVSGGIIRETLFEAHPLGVPKRASSEPDSQRKAPGRGPAARPRRDAAAHQLTLEERLRRTGPAEEPAVVAGLPEAPAPLEPPE